MYFSIVIPTLNEEKALPRLLKDLSNQTFFQEQLEVIHVDGSSDDQTMAVAATFGKKLHLTSLTCKKRNVSEQRNLGALHASGEWIIFMDADNRLPITFLDGLKYQLARNPQTEVFTLPPAPIAKRGKARDRLIYEVMTLQMQITKSLGNPVTLGAMLGSHRSVFSTVQFRPKFKIGEDCEFTREAIRSGYQYELFDEPTYEYSLRRLDRDGFLKQAKIQITLLLRFFDKHATITSNYGYDMSGGATYETRAAQVDRWTQYWQLIGASIQKSRLSTSKEKVSWLNSLRSYAHKLGVKE